MGHSRGMDLGTTFVAAAVPRDRRAEMVPLGDTPVGAHASVHVGGNSSPTSGDAAAGRAVEGAPDGVECLCGAASTDAVLAHVHAAAGGFLHRRDLGDARTVVALARPRRDCAIAKEARSSDVETTIPALLSRHMGVRLSRQEFEDLIRAPVEPTLAPGEPASVGSV